uniref:Reverse transcriptase zinc-binding domain-containing protein n=1 Tax=Brassica oleracea TaxID=3712 RepID=A0A3P6DZQ5_BRAOL|nr:unnamed protein product [Brassica oleracea]
MNCLNSYGDASGQKINLVKSSIIFGAKVSADAKRAVKETLGIDKEGGDGTYLGLPECFSGSKRQLLSFLRRKLQGRLNGWFAKSLSQGGKEILIKSICLALPIYAMSCFRLPKDTCARLRSALTEFWWSNGNNRKKIAWVAWQKLCKSKDQGGLGFKDLEKFNQALLAKQAARVLNNPDSLMAQVLKHRYFKNSSFLDSGVGSRPSFAWRSIIHGRELLQQGLLKKIGSGSDTVVWWDRWILDSIPRVPDYRQGSVVDLTLRVEDLLIPGTGVWNQELVFRTFTRKDAEIIMKIKPEISHTNSVVWGLSRNGSYTSKSGYALLEIIEEINTSQVEIIPPVEKKLWSTLWKTKTTPKLRHFLWRILSGALAVKERLRSRGIQLNITCSSCNNGVEDIGHVLFHCPFAQEVWALSSIPMPPSGAWSRSIFLNLHHLINCGKRKSQAPETGQVFPWILWHIWKARNAFCFEHTRLYPAVILDKALVEAEVWRELQVPTLQRTSQVVVAQAIRNWKKPPTDWVKCNFASSWVNSTSVCSGAWIVRDGYGKAIFHSRRSFPCLPNPLEADLCSLLWTLEDMANMRVDKVIFESSSPYLREAFRLNSSPGTNPMVSRITQLFHGFSELCTELVFDESNKVASFIANSVTRDQRLQSYIGSGGPSWLQTLISQKSGFDSS